MDLKHVRKVFKKPGKPRSVLEVLNKSQTLTNSGKYTDRGSLRTIFLDDTRVGRTTFETRHLPNAQSAPDQTKIHTHSKSDNPLFDLRNVITLPMAEEGEEILIWCRSTLYKATRKPNIFKKDVDFLRNLYSTFIPSTDAPKEVLTSFQIFDESGKKFRQLSPTDFIKGGTLLKLNPPDIRSSQGSSSCDSSVKSLHSYSSIENYTQAFPTSSHRPDVLVSGPYTPVAAPLLRRRNIAVQPIRTSPNSSDSASDKTSPPISGEATLSPSKSKSSDKMHQQNSAQTIRLTTAGATNELPGGTASARIPAQTLIPATVQVGPNGERHLIIQYPDGQTFTAAFPGQGHLHFVSLAKPFNTSTSTQQPTPDPRLIQADEDSKAQPRTCRSNNHSKKPDPLSFHTSKQAVSQKLNLICTCPPELHHVLRQTALPSSADEIQQSPANQLTFPQSDSIKIGLDASEAFVNSNSSVIKEEILPKIQVPDSQSSSQNVHWRHTALPSDAKTTHWNADACQESDSTDTTSGSGQIGFPGLIRGGIPPDVLLASGAKDTIRPASKPPQTLEEAQSRIAFMENQLAYLTSWVQTLPKHKIQQPQGKNEALQTRAYCSAPTDLSRSEIMYPPSNSSLDSAFSAKSLNSSDSCCRQTEAPKETHASPHNSLSLSAQNTIQGNKLCWQIGSTTYTPDPWTFDSIKQGKLYRACQGLETLKDELRDLRRTQQMHSTSIRSITNDLLKQVHRLIKQSALGNLSPLRSVRLDLDGQISAYLRDSKEVEDWLGDLEASIEELRVDALSRRCRVSIAEVETYALHLSRLSGRLAAFKGQIPELRLATNVILEAETTAVKKHERFFEGEPKRLDAALSSCKQLTCTLFTLKRLGAVQEHGVNMNIPLFRTIRDPRPEDKQLFLQQIRRIIPNHEARIIGIAFYEKSRDRRKRMMCLEESLRFERSVEFSQVNLQSIAYRIEKLLINQAPMACCHSAPKTDANQTEGILCAPVDRCLKSAVGQASSSQDDSDYADGCFTVSPKMMDKISNQGGISWNCVGHLSSDYDAQDQSSDNKSVDTRRQFVSYDDDRDVIRCEFTQLAAHTELNQRGLGAASGDKHHSAANEIDSDVAQSYQQHHAPQTSAGKVHSSNVPRRARVVFSKTVLVGDGRETTRLNYPSDLDDEESLGDTEASGADDDADAVGSRYHPWRKEQVHRGNRVVDIHPGLPRNQYNTCNGHCGHQGCTNSSCLARSRSAVGSVLKSSLSSSSSATEKVAPPQPPPRMSSNTLIGLDRQKEQITSDPDSHDELLPAESKILGPITDDDSEAGLASDSGGIPMLHGHHHCCRLNEANQRKG